MNSVNNFCHEWLASWTGNQPVQLLSYYTEDAFYLDPANAQGLHGHSQLLPYFTKLLKHNPDWKWSVQEIIPTQNGFTLKWKSEIPVNGKAITLFGLDIVELSNGKISRNEVYFDRTEWLAALAKG